MASVGNTSQEIACAKGSAANATPSNEKRQPREVKVGDFAFRSSTAKSKESSVVVLRRKASVQCDTSTLYVSNLHSRITESHLELLFKAYGEITRVYFVRKRNDFADSGRNINDPVGFAFVEYKSIHSAKLAIEKIDGRSLLGRFLVVRPAHNRKVGVDRNSNIGSTGKVGDVMKSGDIKLIKKHRYDVENKIEAVKKAIEDARKKRRTD